MEPMERKQLLLFFKDWILSQERFIDSSFETIQLHEELVAEDNYCRGTISIYPDEIVEMLVVNKYTDEPLYYLHFEMNDITVAQQMYIDMIDVLHRGVEPKIRILLCCSNGCTTSYFASKLNAATELLENNYCFDAVPFIQVSEVGDSYDKILLAPQMMYKLAECKKLYGDKIDLIPAKIFATYKVKAVFDWLDKQ